MEDKPPRRRWMRYSLRSLFVIVTLVALYLGWAMNWIRQRREFLNRPPDYWGAVVTKGYGVVHGAKQTQAPLGLRILGEQGMNDLLILPISSENYDPVELTPAKVEQLIDLFPEANIEIEGLVDPVVSGPGWKYEILTAEQWLSQQQARADGDKADP